jgi:hypothetical protein
MNRIVSTLCATALLLPGLAVAASTGTASKVKCPRQASSYQVAYLTGAQAVLPNAHPHALTALPSDARILAEAAGRMSPLPGRVTPEWCPVQLAPNTPR